MTTSRLRVACPADRVAVVDGLRAVAAAGLRAAVADLAAAAVGLRVAVVALAAAVLAAA